MPKAEPKPIDWDALEKELGVKPSALAYLLGTTQPTLWRWRNGERTPNRMVHKLVEYLRLCHKYGLLEVDADFKKRARQYVVKGAISQATIPGYSPSVSFHRAYMDYFVIRARSDKEARRIITRRQISDNTRYRLLGATDDDMSNAPIYKDCTFRKSTGDKIEFIDPVMSKADIRKMQKKEQKFLEDHV